MFIIIPPFLKACSLQYLDNKKVPTVSIIKTVLKAFGDNFYTGHKKFPAAPLTKTSIFPNFYTTFLTVYYTDFSSLTSQLLPKTF